MPKQCPICNTEYASGTKLCSKCMYNIGADKYLSDEEFLNRPSDEEIASYNQTISDLHKLWEDKQNRKAEQAERMRAEAERAAIAALRSKKHPVKELLASGMIEEYLENGGKTTGIEWFLFYKKLAEDFDIGNVSDLKPLVEKIAPKIQKPAENKFVQQPASQQTGERGNCYEYDFAGSASIKPVTKHTGKREIAGMVFVEGGTFLMGMGRTENREKPVHSVTVKSFNIGKFEVTQKEWQEVMGSNPSRFKGENRPVESIIWYGAAAFCNKKSVKEGLTPVYTINGKNVTVDWRANGYRLPTEAEWEYAARGGNKSEGFKYSGSNNIDEVAWSGTGGAGTHKVGAKKPNELGIYDMSGNVWEWCWDWYGENYYKISPGENPAGPAAGAARVHRGGGWSNAAGLCSAAHRSFSIPDYSYDDLGFRLVQCGI